MYFPNKIYRRSLYTIETSQSNNILFVGTSYNRKTKIIDDPECYDMPGLINFDGSLFTKEQELMKNSSLDENYKYIIPFLENLLKKEIEYFTVDPTYETNKTKFGDDPKNYKGHYSMLFNELNENITKKFAVICIMACYKDFFDKNNIDKINKLLDVNGYLIIYDSVPYEFSSLFSKNFLKVV